jgi:hypothetical protein
MSHLFVSMEAPAQSSNGIAQMSRKTSKAHNRRAADRSQSAIADLKRVTLDHVRKACALFDSGSAAPKRHVQSLVLLVGGRRYPAKFIQAVAYGLATGRNLEAQRNRYRDGNTIKFYERLGLITYRGPSELLSPAGPRRDSA